MKSFNNHVKYMSFILKEKHGNILKNVMKYGIGFKILLKKVPILKYFLMTNILQLKESPMKMKLELFYDFNMQQIL